MWRARQQRGLRVRPRADLMARKRVAHVEHLGTARMGGGRYDRAAYGEWLKSLRQICTDARKAPEA